MKKRLIILLLVIIIPILIWIASLVKCEVLTYKHGKEFESLYKQTNMLDKQKYCKVLDYSDTCARVYYVGVNRETGNVIWYIKKDGNWELDEWDTVWSKTGSADGFIWPYIR